MVAVIIILGVPLLIGFLSGWMVRGFVAKKTVKRAHMDPLTGLPDRSVAEEALKRAEKRQKPLTLAMLDINGLKGVNDLVGHAAGDELIVAVSEQLTTLITRLPAGCLVARMGGDEFLIITTASPSELWSAYERVLDGAPPKFSMGIAEMYPGVTSKHAQGCADYAQYISKDTGKPVVVYSLGLGVPGDPHPVKRRRFRD